MINKIGSALSTIILGVVLLSTALFLHIGVVAAQTPAEQVCAGLGAAVGGDGTCTDPEGSSSLSDTVKNAINVLSFVVGVVAVIMVIVGGMKYVSSQGDSSGIASAKNTIVYALVGLVIVALAQVIVRFVVNRSTADPVVPLNNNVSPEPENCALVNGVIPAACR